MKYLSWFVLIHIFTITVDDLDHAYDLMKDVEPLQPAEYILKGVVNAAYGQEHNSVYIYFCYLIY